MISATRAISLAGLIVGAMDIASAIIITLLRGSTVTRLLQFIASGLLGKQAFQGGFGTAALGLVLHFLIAFSLVAVSIWPVIGSGFFEIIRSSRASFMG